MLNEALLDYYAKTAEAAPETFMIGVGGVGAFILGLVLVVAVTWSVVSITIAVEDGEPVGERIGGTVVAAFLGAGFVASLVYLYFYASAEEEHIFGNRDEAVVQALESEYGVTLAEENVGKLLDVNCERTEEGCEPVVATLADGSKKIVTLVQETDESWVLAVDGTLLQPLSIGD